MPRFDLSNAADFSRLTQQSLGDAASLFGLSDPREWDILEGSYNDVVFHVFESKVDWEGALSSIVDSGGRRKVAYKFPYRDGQTTDDLGRSPGSFDLDIVLFGQNYMQGFRQLIAEFDKPTPGKLIHPVRGEITCVVDRFDITHSSDQRKALGLRVTFIEHNFTIGDIRELEDSSVKAALAAALAVFKVVDTAINRVEAAQLLVRGAKNRINALLASYKTNTGRTLTIMNQTFNARGGSADIPALLPVNRGGTSSPDGTVSDDNFVVVRSVSDPFNSVPVEDLTEETIVAIAVIEIEKRVIRLRENAAAIITDIQDSGASLELFDTVIDLRQSVTLVQDVLEKGVSSSNARILDYTVPRLMSIREIAYENGIGVERVQEIDLLNPQLLSVNFIEKDTVVKVPVS